MIRMAKAADAAQIAAIYRPYCVENPVSFETEAPDAAEIAARVEKTVRRFPWLVDEREGAVAGYAYASPHRARPAYRWVAEVTIYVSPAHHGRGIGRALYLELLGRLGRQGYYKAYAGIVLPNPASQGFHEAMGFRNVAMYRGVGFKLGAWRDAGWWQFDLRPQEGPPAEPGPPEP